MNKANALMWIIAGGYLEYQAYGLFNGLSEVPAGTERTVMMIAIVVFVIAGAVIFLSGLKRFIYITKEEKKELAAEEPNTEEQDTETKNAEQAEDTEKE
ncbi:MAG: hypothetical protein U0L05_01985 [Schaedlerella sp.]|nr:hypothetical protein [Schaedlerella sp.]